MLAIGTRIKWREQGRLLDAVICNNERHDMETGDPIYDVRIEDAEYISRIGYGPARYRCDFVEGPICIEE